jgi:hypothetical protein
MIISATNDHLSQFKSDVTTSDEIIPSLLVWTFLGRTYDRVFDHEFQACAIDLVYLPFD